MKSHSILLVLGLALTTACSQDSGSSGEPESSHYRVPMEPVSMDKNDYPVFPDADAGADPSVSAEEGGTGFTGEGWETNTDFDLIGDPHAVKGGILRYYLRDFPGTLRREGPESNTAFNYAILPMVYETLIGLDTKTMKYIPALATYWQISDDKMTFRFRIDPNARFSDGTAVTSEDVIATYDFLMDDGLQAPHLKIVYGRLERPVAESKYIVRVRSKVLDWRNFLAFGGMDIYPAHILKTIDGEQYLRDYNFMLLPGTGPYVVREQDIDKGQSITVSRRSDYWAEHYRVNVGIGNFDKLHFVVVRDENLAFEMFKKGELDFYFVSSARRWIEETNFEAVQRGLVQKRKIFNREPRGFSGFSYNTRRAPFDDIRVRKALTLLLDRPKLIEKIMYSQYEPQNSFYVGRPYENFNNPKNEYNPVEALKLLAEAGWNSRNNQGRLVNNGQPFQFELLYTSQTFEPHLTVYQEDLRRVGITINLRLVTGETQFQLINQRRFEVSHQAWGATLFPNPDTIWISDLADVDNTNNITGMKNVRIDEIAKEYGAMFEVENRNRLLLEMDGILAQEYHYTLHWSAPYMRILYWNKYGTPPGYVSSTGDFIGAGTGPGIPQMWWIEPEKEERLEEAMGDSSIRFEVGPTEDRYWLEREQNQMSSSARTR
jgi:microcin C transport system substrate-binding protein